MSQIVSPRRTNLAVPSVFPNGASAQTGATLDSQIPGRVINLNQARVRHRDKADHMVRMLAVGDLPADAVIIEIGALGREGRRILNAGLADGLESLTERPALSGRRRRPEGERSRRPRPSSRTTISRSWRAQKNAAGDRGTARWQAARRQGGR